MSLRRSGRASKATGASPTPTSDTSALASTSNPTAGAAATGEEDSTASAGAVETRGKRKRTTTSPTLVTSGSTSTRIKLTRGAATLVATQQAQAKQPASSASTAAGTGAGAGAGGETAETQKEKERKPRKRASGKRKWSNKRTKKSVPGSTSAGASAAGGAANGVEEEEGEGDEGEEDVSAEMGDLSAEMNGEGTRVRKIKGALDLLPAQLEREEEQVVLDESLELWLEEGEREQLHVVMRAFMPALLEARLESAEINGTKGKASSTESFSTLAEALDGRPVKLRHLRTHLASLRKAQQVAMRSTSVSAEEKAAQEALLRAHTLLITLIDSLAAARRAADPSVLASTRATLEAQPDAKAEGEGETASGGGRGSATKRKVALHMMLPQGHYFTSAAEVDDARALDVGCADLVSVVAASAPAAGGAKEKGQVPTLGERVYGGVAKSEKEVVRRKQEGEVHRPATHLYYDPYASFAPTHDTQDATLSLGASRLLWENKRTLRDTLRSRGWGAEATLEEQIEEPEAAPAAGGTEAEAEEAVMEKSLTREDFEALHPDLDAAQLVAAYAALEQEAEVDLRLSQSATLLRALQGAQEERLRRGFGKDESVIDTPDERERKLAEQVLQGLAELVKLRPKAVTLDAAGQASQLSLIPRASRLRAAAHSAAIDPALLSADTSSAVVDAGYWGTLDEASFGPDAQRRRKAVEEAAQAAVLASQHVGRPIPSLGAVPTLAPPSVIVDNEVVRLVPAAQKRVKAALAQKGSLVGATSRGAKGDLLTRVAETRGYTPQHAHAVDVAFVRPIVASASGTTHVGTPTPGAPTTPAPQGQRASPVLQRGAPPAQQQQQQAEFAAQQAALHARQAALVRPLPQQQQPHGHYPPNMTPQASSSPSSSQQQQHRANGTPSGSQSYASAGAGPMRQTLGYYPNATPARPLPMAVVPQQQQQSPAWRPPPPQAQQQQRTYAQFVPPSQAPSVPYALYQQQQQQMAQAQAQQQQQGGAGMGMHLPQHPQHGLWVQQQMQAAYAQQQQQQQQQQAARR